MLITDWTPNNGAVFDRPVFAIGDVHGQAEALAGLLAHLEALPGAREGELIFLGDLIDRGPDTLGAVATAFAARDRWRAVQHLPGNHELMLLAALQGDCDACTTWLANGGMDVILEIDLERNMTLDAALDALRARLPEDWTRTYGEGPTHLRRAGGGRVLFVHAGIHPRRDLAETFAQDRFARSDDHWAWIRQPFLGWPKGWGHLGLDLVVHGHTPATTHPLEDACQAAELLDVVADFGCVCLDAGAMRRPQLVAAEFRGERHRLHVLEAPRLDY